MRVLVTGSAGFLGRQVARGLLAESLDVFGFDQAQLPDPEVPTVVGDLQDVEAVTEASRGMDVICHLGAIGDVYLAAANPSLAAGVNVVGSANVAEAARRVDAKVVYASTWEVYGTPEQEPITEDHPCRPDHPYNITKLAGERMLLAADHLQGVPVIALRLGTAYGNGLRPNSVFRIFIDRAMRGESITIQGDGLQGRQFTHSSDIARAFALACRSSLNGTVLNIVSDEFITIRELAERVTTRFPAELNVSAPRAGEVPTARVSNARALSLLRWKPQMSFDDGLAMLFEERRSE